MIQDYKISKKAYKKSLKYIQARMNGNNKKESALMASYSYGTNPDAVERTKAYAVAISDVLNGNALKLSRLGKATQDKIDEGELEKLSLKDVVDISLKLAQIHKILVPQVTIKEEQMKDGTTKRTVWGEVN